MSYLRKSGYICSTIFVHRLHILEGMGIKVGSKKDANWPFKTKNENKFESLDQFRTSELLYKTHQCFISDTDQLLQYSFLQLSISTNIQPSYRAVYHAQMRPWALWFVKLKKSYDVLLPSYSTIFREADNLLNSLVLWVVELTTVERNTQIRLCLNHPSGCSSGRSLNCYCAQCSGFRRCYVLFIYFGYRKINFLTSASYEAR